MLFEAASPLGIALNVLAERPDDSAALVASNVELGSPFDPKALAAFAASNDVITFDHELVDAATLAELESAGRRVYPSAAVVALAQSKLAQRQTLATRGFPVPEFRPAATSDALLEFGHEHGWPVVAKAVRGGYDGRGVWVLADESEAGDFASAHDLTRRPCLVEGFVPIERELAVLVARRPSGESAVYPLVETVQVDGICREILAPAPNAFDLADLARTLAARIADAIDVVGILAVELFQTQGRLVVNELAARPHNSGHYTIEGCITSQFEQHLRAVLDWPLGQTELRAPAVATVNVLGAPSGTDPLDRLPYALANPGVHVHLYGKAARLGRKLGHVTATGDDPSDVRARARQAAAILTAGADQEGQA
jgi:5-(carboxyamino)imidazole ribonucleotide synthase